LTSSLRPLRLGDEKKERLIDRRKKKKPQGKNIMSASAMQGGHKKPFPSPKPKHNFWLLTLMLHICQAIIWHALIKTRKNGSERQ